MILPMPPAVRRTLGWAALAAAFASIALANTAIEPVGREEPYVVKRRGQILERAKEGHINVVFLGDSITDFWRFEDPKRGGRVIWDQEIAPLGAANFGVSGDRTQHVLWRLQQGDMENLKPKVVVLMIGTNNTGFERDNVTPRNTPAETVEGVTRIVQTLRAQLPEAKILLLAIFPRGAQPDHPQRAQIAEINASIQKLADREQVFWLDFTQQLLEPDGTLSPEVMPDHLHPGAKGYRIWMDAIREPLRALVNHTVP
jgi:lysophospholipase L1-like esterase